MFAIFYWLQRPLRHVLANKQNFLSFTCNILNNTILVGLPKFITGTRHSLWFPGILAQTSQQSVGNNSLTIRLSTNAPQGCMLSLQLYSVHCIHDCTTNYRTNSLIKFADLTTAFWDESANREEIQKLTVRCWENNLSLHKAKTKELTSMGPVWREFTASSFWNTNTRWPQQWNKTQQRLHFLRTIRRSNMKWKLLLAFH